MRQSSVVELPVSRPGPGQVLLRVAASPINPPDQMFIRGLYGFKKPVPPTPGFEGSGTVVEAGSGIVPQFLKGRRLRVLPRIRTSLAACRRNTW